MIKDFAIDPDSIDKIAYLRFLNDTIGFQHGRLIYEIPIKEDWIGEVSSNVTTDPLFNTENKEHEIIITHLAKSGFSRRKVTIDSEVDWLKNSQDALQKSYISGIITNIPAPEAIEIATLSSLNPIWETHPDLTVKRSPGHFQSALLPIISRSKKMKIIDPYFDIMEERFYKFLRVCYLGASSEKGVRIEVHCDAGHCQSSTVSNFVNNWKTSLRDNVGRRVNIEVRILLWKQMRNSLKIHDRYLLTDIGGVRIPTGLDLIGDHDEADISRMGYEVYSKIYSRYDSNGNNPQLEFIGSYILK